MSKEIIVLDNIEIEKRKFYHHKNLVMLQDVDIDNILICSIASFLAQYFQKKFCLCKKLWW